MAGELDKMAAATVKDENESVDDLKVRRPAARPSVPPLPSLSLTPSFRSRSSSPLRLASLSQDGRRAPGARQASLAASEHARLRDFWCRSAALDEPTDAVLVLLSCDSLCVTLRVSLSGCAVCLRGRAK